jgi:hypothetical protein
MMQGIGQDSSRARRFEVEDAGVSMIPILGFAASSSLRACSFLSDILPALFVRGEPASQTSQRKSGGTATSSASVGRKVSSRMSEVRHLSAEEYDW